MTIGSLFSGIGGIELGLESCGLGPVLWQVERDPYCLRVLNKHWPGVKRFVDVRMIDAQSANRVDVICGGFPCQDISTAGKGAGLEGARSGLWSEYARIVRELRPRYALVENVAALANRGLDRVLGDLAACGYDAEWDCFRASDVGAPHRRERIFILAHAHGNRLEGLERAGAAPGAAFGGGNVAHTNGGRLEGFGQPQQRGLESAPGNESHGRDIAGHEFPPGPTGIHAWDGPKPTVRRDSDGAADRVDRLRALGNAVVPQVAALAWRTLASRFCENNY